MFGPNNKPEIHHREKSYAELHRDTKEAFLKLAQLDGNIWDVFFITGSGTCAIESMLYSVTRLVTVASYGHFSDRASDYLAQTNNGWPGKRGPVVYNVLYETSESKLNNGSLAYSSDGEGEPTITPKLVITDAVSAFPYYRPSGTSIWATVSSKQLGCAPGLSVVVMRKSLWYDGTMKVADASYMSLAKYKLKDDINQTPHTPAISLMREFNHALHTFNIDKHRKMIDSRRKEIVKHIPDEFLIGEGPVVTIKNVHYTTQRLVTELDLYNNSSIGPQIFLWSGTDEQYDQLYKTLERIYKKDT